MTFLTHPERLVLTKGEIKRLQGPYEAAYDHVHTSHMRFFPQIESINMKKNWHALESLIKISLT